MVLTAACIAWLAAFVATPMVRAWARAHGRIARPAADRWHTRPTALLGGMGIWAGFLAGAAAWFLIPGGAALLDLTPGSPGRAALAVVAGAAVMFVCGVVDDVLGLRPATKLVLQALGGAVLVGLGVVYQATPWPFVNGLVTIMWFIALTNALNLLDNMDGVTAGVAGIAGLLLAALFLLGGSLPLAAVALALAGAATGFLPYNFRPASIFMGDSGSLFLGAALAGLSAAYSSTAPFPAAALLVPVVVLAVPLFDTSLVVVTRTLARHSIARGGRDHVSHRLVAMGLTERSAALALYGIALLGGALALLLHAGAGEGPWLVIVFVAGMGVLGGYLHRFFRYPVEGARPVSRFAVVVEELLFKRRLLEVMTDLPLFAAAYGGAYLLRYDSGLPPDQATLLVSTVPIAVACKAVAFSLLGVYHGTWRRMGVSDAHRVLAATGVGALMTIATTVFFYREAAFSRSVFILDALLVVVLALGARLSFRSLDLLRFSLNGNGERALVYGAGSGADLILRELVSNPSIDVQPVGLVDDDPALLGRRLHGCPVLGDGDRLEALVEAYQVRTVIIGTRALDARRLEAVRSLCARRSLRLLQLELELKQLALARPRAEPLSPDDDPFVPRVAEVATVKRGVRRGLPDVLLDRNP